MAEEDLVTYDYKKGSKTEIPSFARPALEATIAEQAAEQIRARSRIWQLLDAVEKLETSTWKRVDAVEDTGNAGVQK